MQALKPSQSQTKEFSGMIAFNFRERKLPQIMNNEKPYIILKERCCQRGDEIEFYAGRRISEYKKIGSGVCVYTRNIIIDEQYLRMKSRRAPFQEIISDPDTLDDIAASEGFTSWSALVEFYDKKYGLPFYGVIHAWRDFKPTRAARKMIKKMAIQS